ncbi:MAG: bifunctional aldolase/short-chain dehydrogenase [Syntrophus sp. (in: bacteria)]|nr:bifunctional aldolase/short-chain dehydrogenase [Syntrophus sp. (in: bacteria)]
MNNAWIEAEANDFVETYSAQWGNDLALLAYATRLVGSQPDLAMHGGGNTSVKGRVRTLAGDEVAALFVKASGLSMDAITPAGFVCLDQAYLKKLRALSSCTDEIMTGEFRTRMLKPSDALPSIETLMHAFLDSKAIVHTHPTAILTLAGRIGGEEALAAAIGDTIGMVPYVNSGLALGRAVADKYDRKKGCQAIVALHHGLITWGETPKQAYDRTIEIVGRAEETLRAARRHLFSMNTKTDAETAQKRYTQIAPLLRGLLSPASADPDNPYEKITLVPLITQDTLEFLDSPQARELACTAPLTPDYLVRTKAYPLFIEKPDYDDPDLLRRHLAGEIDSFRTRYDAYMKKYASRLPEFTGDGFDLLPKVLLLPGLGAVCAGPDLGTARIARDITGQTLFAKRTILETGGTYLGLTEDHLFDMEFRAFQRAKVAGKGPLSLRGSAAIVTGAAGAIGSGICDELLRQGCNVAVTDLAGEPLDAMVHTLKGVYGDRVLGVPLDVTESASVSAAFEKTVAAFGGIDILVINAGLAHVSSLTEMDLEAFRKLERVNVEGTLLLLARAGELFRQQNIGGDIVLVSTKNVFAPGAKFGAYSATKAAAHQLCRIASIEFAEMGVRVNMVAPDAVFSHGEKKSGLWAQVGPDRMKARGLDEKGLEAYYRQRNLLKAQVTAEHVARAVVFFVTRRTPTTGATLPVDGGLPDATPR